MMKTLLLHEVIHWWSAWCRRVFAALLPVDRLVSRGCRSSAWIGFATDLGYVAWRAGDLQEAKLSCVPWSRDLHQTSLSNILAERVEWFVGKERFNCYCWVEVLCNSLFIDNWKEWTIQYLYLLLMQSQI
jgi:hypothetical protein